MTIDNQGNSSPIHTGPTGTGNAPSRDPSRGHNASSTFIGSKNSMAGLQVNQSLQDMITPKEAYHDLN